MGAKPTREDAWALLTKYVASENLRRHALAVEAVMRHMARKRGEDEELWGVVGLIHDVDYERYPEAHLRHAPEILEEHGWPPDLIRAVLSHGWGICTDVEPRTDLEKTLFAIDELTGLVSAAALVRPSRSILTFRSRVYARSGKTRHLPRGWIGQSLKRGRQCSDWS